MHEFTVFQDASGRGLIPLRTWWWNPVPAPSPSYPGKGGPYFTRWGATLSGWLHTR